MVLLHANINGESSEELKLKPSEYFFCLMQIYWQFKGCTQFKGSNQRVKGVNFPYAFFAFIMDENKAERK